MKNHKKFIVALSLTLFPLGLLGSSGTASADNQEDLSVYLQKDKEFLALNSSDYNQIIQIGDNKIAAIKDVNADPGAFGLSVKIAFLGGTGQAWNQQVAYNQYYVDSNNKGWTYGGYRVEQDHTIYRLYNPNTGEHFYTASSYETLTLQKGGWTFEGIGWQSPTDQSLGYSKDSSSLIKLQISPVYRLYNPNAAGGDHYYTTSDYEADSLVAAGWEMDNEGKPAFYTGGDSPIFVAYNPSAASGSHNYTKSSYEQNSLLQNGWKFGSTSFYGG